MDIKKCPCGRVEFKKGLVAVYITGMDQYEGGGVRGKEMGII